MHYAKGRIPCRLSHSASSKASPLTWEVDLEASGFNPLALYMFQGLVETAHPYTFIVEKGIKDMITSQGSKSKFVDSLPFLIQPLRNALQDNVEIGLWGLVQLTKCVCEAIIPSLAKILPVLQKRALAGHLAVLDALKEIECICGPACVPVIKLFIPTYVQETSFGQNKTRAS